MTTIVEAEHLEKAYGALKAVDDISFDISKGEFFGFLGPNGAGKTTTINMLTTLAMPTGGRATVNGHDILTEADAVRRSIGLVFQDPTLDVDLTAWENLKFHCYLYDMSKATAEERMNDMLALVELSDRKKDRVKYFSGGMKRRLEIARGLLHYPHVLFLDEPTIGLDPQSRLHMWEFIHKLRAQEDITVFLTTHYMDEAEHCDRIAIIDHGKIVALDSPANLKESLVGEVIYLTTKDDAAATRQIKEKFDIDVQDSDKGLMLTVKGAPAFTPKLFDALSIPITSIQISQPTLNDVFIHITGHEMRDEEADSDDVMRDHIRTMRTGRTRARETRGQIKG